MTFDFTPDTPRRSRRHIPPRLVVADIKVQAAAAPRSPAAVALTPFRTLRVSNGRQIRVFTSTSSIGRAVVLRAYARARPSAPMLAIGKAFTVLRADLDLVVAALTEAGATLDALVA